MQRWDDRVRAEVSPAAGSTEIVLRDSLPQMLQVMAKVLADKTDPRTAARDLAYLTVHGKEHADQTTYSLQELILEFHILQEVVWEAVEPDGLLDTRDRGVVIQYVADSQPHDAQAQCFGQLRSVLPPSTQAGQNIVARSRCLGDRFIGAVTVVAHSATRHEDGWPRRGRGVARTSKSVTLHAAVFQDRATRRRPPAADQRLAGQIHDRGARSIARTSTSNPASAETHSTSAPS